MKGRALFRQYAKALGKEANSFVEIKSGIFGNSDTLITKDSNDIEERTSLDYKHMVHWIIANTKIIL